CCADPSPTPIIAISLPNRSICCSTSDTGSSVDSPCGTSLNMYSTGNSKSSFDSRSLVCLRMKSYWAEPWCGNPSILSIAGSPPGPGMESSYRNDVPRVTGPRIHTETRFYQSQCLNGALNWSNMT